MPRTCVACEHTKTKKINSSCAMICFPKDVNISRKWIQVIGNTDYVDILHDKMVIRHLCSCHFEETDMKKTGRGISVRPQAIPTRLGNVVPLTDMQVAAYPPGKSEVVQTSRIEVPLSELDNLVQTTDLGVFNSFFVRDSQTGSLRKLQPQGNECSIPVSTSISQSSDEQFSDSVETISLESATILTPSTPRAFHMFGKDAPLDTDHKLTTKCSFSAMDIGMDEDSFSTTSTTALNRKRNSFGVDIITSLGLSNTIASQEENDLHTSACHFSKEIQI